MAVHATIMLLMAATIARALHSGFDRLAGVRKEAAHAKAAASEALARAKAAQQKVRELGGADPVDSPFWFKDLFPFDSHSDVYRKDPWIAGPTPVDDLGILYAAIKELRPKTLVEFGFWVGDGTRVLLSAADAGATVHSFDPTPPRRSEADKLMAEALTLGRNFVFHEKPGEDITSEDLAGDKVGFAFIDTAHKPNMTQNCFEKLLPMLTDDAIVAIHDTGVWGKKFLDENMGNADTKQWWENNREFLKKYMNWPGDLVLHGEGDEQYYIHPDANNERKFVNWMMDAHPEWGIMNFHSLNTIRLGITMMQRQRKLDVF